MERLAAGELLEPRYRCHPLRGDFARHCECHVGPDFLLIWYLSAEDRLVFVRTGSHEDLFG
jgi:mRNA interferase YafQ